VKIHPTINPNMVRKYLPKNTEELIHWYERYLAPLALIAGFLLDTFFFLERVDVMSGNLLLLSYLVIAALMILLLQAIETGRLPYRPFLAIAPFVPVVIQFAFGGLFSGYLSLYSRSASFAITWIFVALIAALLLGNERFRTRYVKFPFQVSVLFTALLSFLIFFIPVLLNAIGNLIFVLSGIVGLLVITAFLYFVRMLMPEVIKRDKVVILRSIASIFVVFNILYFSNAIPPLPLALKDAGVYHGLTRLGDKYQLITEVAPWYKKYLPITPVFHRTGGESAYVFSAVFAPTGLSTTISHEWQRYDEVQEEWVTLSTQKFPIRGGRDGGYRGYTIKNDLKPGDWRVNVMTEYGQIVGRISFEVVEVAQSVPLETITQ